MDSNLAGRPTRPGAPRRRPGLRRPAAWLALAALAALGAGSAQAQGAGGTALVPFASAQGSTAPAPWHFSTLPNKKPTRFEVVSLDGQRVLKVEADDSYGNLVHPLKLPVGPNTTLDWRWRVDQLVEGADLHTRSGDDGAAKLCVSFDYPSDHLSLGERAKLALAHSSTGENVPAETLCYVWDNKLPKGTLLDNAFTDRIRMLVLQSGPSATPGTWVSERRNLQADYLRAFGNEAIDHSVPNVVAMEVQADADNTHGHGLSYFADLAVKNPGAAPSAAASDKNP